MKATLTYKPGSYPVTLSGAIFLVVSALFSLTANIADAASPVPCGSIIAPDPTYGFDSALVTTPITDCNDPFVVTTDVASPYTFSIEGQAISNGDTIEVPEGGTNNFVVAGAPLLSGHNDLLFLHDGNDYRYVNTQLLDPTEAEYRTLAQSFFPADTDINPYIAAILSGDNSLEDPDMQNLLYDFLDYVDAHFVPQLPHLRAGTYTLLIKEYELILSEQTLFQKMFAYVIPTAHAQSVPLYPENRFTITFTMKKAVLAPTGASSVLFLPGIQSSRLYTDGILGSEDQLWEPNGDSDVEQLEMTDVGESVNSVYTRDVIKSLNFFAGDVYSNLLDFLEELTTAPTPIKDYTAFAYDWRYGVTDIVSDGTRYENDEIKSLVAEVERLSNESYTRKVTIIAHSNGGLVAKALVSELERRNIKDKVDKIIFIAVPHLGTPKAIGTILHGYDQEYAMGLVMSQGVAREVINNMPGAYGLLPSEKYITSSSEPVVTFDTSITTAPYRVAYGGTITTYEKYRDFLIGNTESDRTLSGAISTPAKANQTLLDNAFNEHKNTLDDWVAPAGVEVIEIVGTGLVTMKGIEYREVIEGQDCVSVGGTPAVCTPRKFLKPYAQLSKYGDETVMQRSAEGVDSDKTFYVNLKTVAGNKAPKYKHFNITEVPQVLTLLDTILSATSTSVIDFVSESAPSFADEYSIEIIDSPVRMLATDSLGNQTGVKLTNGDKQVVVGIPESQYFEFGGSKYIVLPKTIEHTTQLFGEANGAYGLTIATLGGDNTQAVTHRFQNSPVTPQMVATYTEKDGVYSTIKTDITGDGVTDTETTIDGVVVRYTYADLRFAITGLNLTKAQRKVLLEIVVFADQAGKQKVKYPVLKVLEKTLLTQLLNLLNLYKTKKMITQEQFQEIKKVILSLLNT